MIIATAGHVDHGKTALLEALTGTNADRLPEEKKRGMTIDLGYAFLPLANDRVLGFVDVPGHEKFLSNMLAGIGGIQHALLVIACDDGLMPQTLEHLSILRLAGRPPITVALTKADRVGSEQIAFVRQQISIELERQGWDTYDLFVTSVITGQGITSLREHFSGLVSPTIDKQRRFRLAIDRAFTIKGSGLVVTGTALAGHVSVGDNLWLTGSDRLVRVRNLHAQDRQTNSANAGKRIALNIAGNIEKQQISRGDWLLSEPPIFACNSVLVVLTIDCPITHWQSVHLYHAARHITGRISLLQPAPVQFGQPILAEIIFDKPLYIAENDLIILRHISAHQTIGSAKVIELSPPKRGKRQASYLEKLSTLSKLDSDHQILNERLRSTSLCLKQFAWARQLTTTGLNTLLSDFDGIIVQNIALSNHLAKQFRHQLLITLADYHQHHNDQPGIGREKLYRMIFPDQPQVLIFSLIDQLLTEGKLLQQNGWLYLPDYRLTLNPKEHAVWLQLKPLFGKNAVWVRDLAQASNNDETEVRTLLRKAAQLGEITAIVKDRYYLTSQIRLFAKVLRQLHSETGVIQTINFRDQLACGRKLAIQILEFFDRCGFTRRKGHDRVIRDESLFID